MRASWFRRPAKVAVAGAVVAGLASGGFALAASVGVSLTRDGPQPATLTVGWGDTVAFSNADTAPHTITFSRDALPAATVQPGAATSYVLTGKNGGYRYRQIGARTPGAIDLKVAGSLSLHPASPNLAYGQRLKLTGTVSVLGTTVVLQKQGAGRRSWDPLETLVADAEGHFAGSLVLHENAKLRAVAAGGQLSSAPVSISVEPTVAIRASTLRPAGGTPVAIRGTVRPARAARYLSLTAFDAKRQSWRLLARARLGSLGVAVFHWTAAYGTTRLRVSLGRKDTAPTLSPAVSRSIVVTGLGTRPPKHHAHAAARHHRRR
jgi:plastocyanin